MLNLNKEILNFFQLIYNQSLKTYFVGGFSRNYFLKKPFDNDFDLSINCNPNYLLKILTKNNYFPILNAIEYGTISFFIKKNKIEITSCRSDIKTFGRKAIVEFTDDFHQDSLRRDFTINAIYLNHNEEILDYHNGIKDLQANKLKFIGNPEKRIQEDYLRILRYFRFLGKMNLEIDYEILEIIKNQKHNLQILSKERITDELKKISKTKNSWNILDLLFKYEILPFFKEIKKQKLEILDHNFISNKLNYLFSYILNNVHNADEILKIIKNELSLTKDEKKIIDYLRNNKDIWNEDFEISIQTKLLLQKISNELFNDIFDIIKINPLKQLKIGELYYKIKEIKIKNQTDFLELNGKTLGEAIRADNIATLKKIN